MCVCAKCNAILKFSDEVTRVYTACPWNQEKPCDDILAHSTERDDQLVREMSMVSTKTHSRLLACILHGLEALEAAHLWNKADDEVRTVMLSSGGPGNGSLWIAPTRSARDLLPDAHFTISTALRLGCESNAKDRQCALLKYRDDPESQCGQSLDSRLHHTLTCKAGLARMRQHRAIAATLTSVLKQSGAQVDRERPAPDMYELEVNDRGEQVVKEAILDLAVNFPGQLCTHWIDVSVRAPVAERYTTSATKVATCAMTGEQDKQRRYKGKALPMVMESFGRLGPESEKVLDLLAKAAGHTARPRPVLHVWRDRLRRALWFATADAALQALGRAAAPEAPD